MLIAMSLHFILLVLKQINEVVVVTISMIHNVKVFNLMSRTNETRHIEWHKTCKCKCRLDGSVRNNKQPGNDDRCRCECK